MPKRMRAYAALAEEKYDLPTYPVLINILKDSEAEIPKRYESEFAGLQARQDYHVINLWEVDVEIALSQPIPSLLPFLVSGIAQATKVGLRGRSQTLPKKAPRTCPRLRNSHARLGSALRWRCARYTSSPWRHSSHRLRAWHLGRSQSRTTHS